MAILAWLNSYFRASNLRQGQGLVEYALLLIMVGVVVVAILAVLGPGIRDTYQNIINVLDGVV